MDKKIYVFYTINQLGDWKQVMSSQVTRLIKSGLFDAATRIFVGVYGNDSSVALPQKFSVIHKSNDASDQAMEMLDIIGNFARNNDCVILNMSTLHSEYYGRAQYPYIQDWREYLEHFNVQSWKECITRLKTYDLIGVDWQSDFGSFDGNFWWAKSTYLSKLPTLESLRSTNITIDSLKGKWIGMGNPNVGELHKSGITNHYMVSMPKSTYADGAVPIINISQPQQLQNTRKREPALEKHRPAMPTVIMNTAPPLIPVRHSTTTPPLHKHRSDSNFSIKIIIDCRNGMANLSSYITAMKTSTVYDNATIRVALFSNNDYDPLENFICYGPNLTKEVIESIPLGINSYILCIDASVEPESTDLAWIRDWQNQIKCFKSDVNIIIEHDHKYVAWVRNSEINKFLI